MEEFDEPSVFFDFRGSEYPSWGNLSGRYRTMDYDQGKFNRYAKIGSMADRLEDSFRNMVESDTNGVSGRCAYAALMMMNYGVRVGNEDSAEGYVSSMEQSKGEVVQTYGTTTLRNKHISFDGGDMNLHFLGKEQVENYVSINDPFLVRFGRVFVGGDPDDKWLGIDYDVMFDFVKTYVGDGFVPKDFRTFCANVTAWNVIKEKLDLPKPDTRTEVNEEVSDIVDVVSARLQNTPGIAKSNYIDKRMLDWFKNQRFDYGEVNESREFY
jgi:DNA topoisomerase IB